jgi:hypothetical protein
MQNPIVYNPRTCRFLDASLNEVACGAPNTHYAIDAADLAVFAHALIDGTTIVVAGSTGAGKSSLAGAINNRTGAALYDEIRTQEQALKFVHGLTESFDPIVTEIHAPPGGALQRLSILAGRSLGADAHTIDVHVSWHMIEVYVSKDDPHSTQRRIKVFVSENAVRNVA